MLKKDLKNVFYLKVLLLIIAFVLVACTGTREPIDVAEFQAIMTAENFEVIDATYQVSGDDDISLILLAMADSYQIQLTEFNNISEAQRSFNYFRNYADDVLRSGSYSTRSSEGSNFSSFSLTTGGVYFNLLRIDNIVLLTEAPREYRNEIRNVIGMLN